MLTSRVQFQRPILFIATFAAIAFAVLACRQSSSGSAGTTGASATTVTCANAVTLSYNPKHQGTPVVNIPTALDSTCAQIPYAPVSATGFGGEGDATNQDAADMYSWLSFIALNWPVNPQNCVPNPNANIVSSPNNPTWMSYATTDDVFKTSGPPAGWCGGGLAGANGLSAMQQARIKRLPAAVQKLAAAHPEVHLYLSHDSKSGELTSSMGKLHAALSGKMQGILESTGLPIVDQNGRYARYSISMNQDEYALIANNGLYTEAGQAKYGNVTFPVSNQSAGVMGAVEIKAAWKVMGPNDVQSRFFTAQAIVYNDASGQPSPGPNPVTVGLIGLHILHKSQGQTNWAWSTFEQVDNDTTSFFNKNCQPPSPNPNNHCVVNATTIPQNQAQTAPELNAQGQPLQFPTQIQQQPWITQTGLPYTSGFQTLLAGTPWAYYRLISTQWSGGAQGIIPQFLGASVQETFVPQKTGPDSCIGCHTGATDLAGNTTEFSFMLLNGQSGSQAKHH